MSADTEIRSAARRDGVVLQVGDRVVTDYHPGCVGCVFVVLKITPHATCESGFMVLVHLEHEPQRTLQGLDGLGLDTNWFKLHHAERPTAEG